MLRKRSRVVGSRQGLMSDYPSLPSPTAKYSRLTSSSLFSSPRLFSGGASGKGSLDNEQMMSPTSILDTKHFSAIGSPFFSDRPKKPPVEAPPSPPSVKRHHPWENGEPRAIGLGIVESLNEDKNDYKSSNQESRKVLFGSQLKIQIPPMSPSSTSPTRGVESPFSPMEFGIKTKNLFMGSLSPSLRSRMGSENLGPEAPSPRVFRGCLSTSAMELSEDYTCVITHGPNPKTTHIFDNYIVESCGDDFSAMRKENGFIAGQLECPPATFLSYCHACKKGLEQGKDIFMYRGDKAFCSRDCRSRGMMFYGEMDGCSELTGDL